MNNKKETTLGNITVSIFDGKHGDCEDEPNTGYYFVSVKDLKEYAAYVKDNPKLAEHEFYKSGYAGLKFDQTEHRMIIK